MNTVTARLRSTHAPQGTVPRLHAATLHFKDDDCELAFREHQWELAASTFQLGLILGMMVLVSFGIVDYLLAPGQTYFIWSLRLIVLLVSIVLLYARKLINDHRKGERIAVLTTLLYGALVCTHNSVLPQQVVNLYYAGIMLIMMGANPILGLEFCRSVIVSLTLCLATVLIFFVRQFPLAEIANHVCFLASCLVISSLGAYRSERARRVNFFVRGIIEREREESRRQALVDPLCNIPNRRLLMQKMDRAMAEVRETHGYIGVVFLDVDNFKEINDVFGHHLGDRVLQDVSARLITSVPESATVARIAGDEFVVLVDGLVGPDLLNIHTRRMADAFRKPMQTGSTQLSYHVSIGSGIFPGDAETPEALLEIADRRMYSAKRSGRRGSVLLFGGRQRPQRSQ